MPQITENDFFMAGVKAAEALKEERMSVRERKALPAARNLAYAYDLLRRARDLCVAAGAKRTADRIRLAISSIKGARRHADLAPFRDKRRNR